MTIISAEPVTGGTEYHSGRLGQRHLLMLLLFFGCICKQATRVGLSVAMVAMVKPPIALNITLQYTDVACPQNLPPPSNGSELQLLPGSTGSAGYFDWDSTAQGILHGAFYYGYLFSQVPGGWLSHRFGPTRPITICSFLTGAVTLLSPPAAYGSFWLLFIARVIIGICTGVIVPSMTLLASEWSPPLERGRLISGAGSGSLLGTVAGMFVSGLLTSAFGWESIFYTFGIIQILWLVPWIIFARDSPSVHPRISHEERQYILTSLGRRQSQYANPKRRRLPIPWKRIFRTGAFYAILVAEFAHNWGYYTILTNLPTYLSNIQHYSIKKNGLLSALPYLVRWISVFFVVLLGDCLLTRKIMSVSLLRSTFSGVSFVLTAAALIGVGYAGCDSTLAVSLLVVTVGVQSLNSSGYFLGYADMSPELAGVLVGLGNGFGTTTGILAPLVAGVLTNGPGGHSIQNWKIVFFIAAGMYLFGAVIYWVFGSAEKQPWDPTVAAASSAKVAVTRQEGTMDKKEADLEEKVTFIDNPS